jgi:hypothetical protein
VNNKPPPAMGPNLKAEFYEALMLEPDKLKDIHVRALIRRVSFLDDEERYKYRHVLVRENLSKDEEKRARASFSKEWFHKYFPPAGEVETHYLHNFTRGRKS